MIDLAYVIPAHESAATIRQTLQSVLAQRGVSVLAVVVDDGSSDGTGDQARLERDWRVEVVRQANRGLSGARNTGLEVVGERARGVCFLDADDTVEPGHAATLAGRLLDADHPADMACCGYRMLGPALEDVAWGIEVSDAELAPERLIEFNPMAVGGVAIGVEALREVGGPRPFDESLAVLEDWDLWLRLTGAGRRWAEPAPEHLFNYRMRPGSLSRGVERMWRTGVRVLERQRAALAEPERVDGSLRRWTLRNLARAAVSADGPLIGAMLGDLSRRGGRAMDSLDAAAFSGSLRHAVMAEHAIGPAGVAGFEQEWKARLRRALSDWPEAFPAIDRVEWVSWDAVADRLARLLRRDGRGRLGHLRPLVAGMGRNGRALATALGARGIGFDWLDDDAEAACAVRGSRRVDAECVGPRHLAIVTPAAPDGLAARLRETRALVMRAWELLEHVEEDRRRVA